MATNRAHNFCAGPCVLPVPVLEELRDEFVDFAGSGMALIELSHRAKLYEDVHLDTLDRLRRVSGVPDDFDVLMIQGGASLQFAMVPMNLLGDDDHAGYVKSGTWGNKAYADAATVGNAYVAWDGGDSGYSAMPSPGDLEVRADSRYVHLASNETIGGIRIPSFDGFDWPLVIDASSDYLARPLPWDRAELVYGGVQKNLGPAGMAVVFARKSVVERSPAGLPSALSYKTHADADSMANTPPMFTVWATGKMLEWIERSGGMPAMEKRAAERSGRIYEAIDGSGGFYNNPVAVSDRSHTNVVFTLGDSELEAAFLAGAADRNMANLKGHRSVGGIRASVYNALPDESVDALVEFMGSFQAEKG